MIIKKKGSDEGRIVSSYITDTYKIVKDGQRIIIRRLKKEFAQKASYINAFREEIEKGKNWDHKNILKYGEIFQDEEGIGVQMETVSCITLEDFLNDNPAFMTRNMEVERILKEVINALFYLHTHGAHHLDLHPHNILLTKDSHTVKLINPMDTYLSLTPNIFTTNENDYTAPELVDGNVSDLMRSDIYSLGKFILYLYSMATIPYRYQVAIKKAINENPKKRYPSIKAFEKEISFSRFKLACFKGIIWSGAIALVCWFIYWGTSSSLEDEIHFIKPTATDTYVYDSINGKGYYVSDSAMIDNAEAISQEEFKKQREYELKAQTIFKKEFKKKAEPIISNIYSRKNMSGEIQNFSNISGQGMSDLQEIQDQLSKQYEIDPVTTAKMATEIIEELARNKMENLYGKEKEE